MIYDITLSMIDRSLVLLLLTSQTKILYDMHLCNFTVTQYIGHQFRTKVNYLTYIFLYGMTK